MAIQTAYKVTGADGRAHHGGRGTWPLPEGESGRWKSVRGELIPCHHGLHLCRKQDLVHWLGPAIWRAAYHDDDIVVHGNKIVVRKARLVERMAWDERIARLFAADCAERAIRYAKKCGIGFGSSEKALRAAIRTARAFANGDASNEQRSAAYSAACSAADSAAYSAADSAACSAADSAACSAAYSAADSAAREWQTRRLFEYLNGKRG